MRLEMHEVIDAHDQLVENVTTSEKIKLFSQICQDPQLANTLLTHAQQMDQMAARLTNALNLNPQYVTGQVSQPRRAAIPQAAGQQIRSLAANQQIDHLVTLDCLKDCKNLAIKATFAATEASTPEIRRLYQEMCGAHLQMADQHYRYAEQRGFYHSANFNRQMYQEVGQYIAQDVPNVFPGAFPQANAAAYAGGQQIQQ